MSVAIAHTVSGEAAIVIVSEAVSAMLSILPDFTRARGDCDRPGPGRERGVRHCPEPVEPEPQHRHEEADGERRAGLPSGPSRRAKVVIVAITT